MQAEFREMLERDMAEANAGITHAAFVSGMAQGVIGFKCMFGPPHRLLFGVRKIAFSAFCLLYQVAPLIIVPICACLVGNPWFLFGIVASYAGSSLAARKSNLIYLYFFVCLGGWFVFGFSIHQYPTFFFFCALWGYVLFRVADDAQFEYAMQVLLEDEALFKRAISSNQIMIVFKDGRPRQLSSSIA